MKTTVPAVPNLRGFGGRTHRRWLGNDRGFALVITLFIVALVTVLVLEFYFEASVELDLSVNYSHDVQAYHLAMAGIQFAKALLLRDQTNVDGPEDDWYKLALLPACFGPKQLIELAQTAQSTSGTPTPPPSPTAPTETEGAADPRAEGCVTLRITDEAGKLPLNALLSPNSTADTPPDATWLNVFKQFFRSVEIDPEIVDALVDWVDQNDDEYGTGGAENSYYERLSTPYKTQGGPMRTIGDLRLIRGFDAETLAKLFPGKTPDDVADLDLGTNPYLTVYGTSSTTVGAPPVSPPRTGTGATPPATGAPPPATSSTPPKVNVNTASREVLQAMIAAAPGGGTPPDIDDLLTRRQSQQFKTVNEALPGAAALARLLDVKSQFFRVESVGHVDVVQKKIVAVLQRTQNTATLVYFKVE